MGPRGTITGKLGTHRGHYSSLSHFSESRKWGNGLPDRGSTQLTKDSTKSPSSGNTKSEEQTTEKTTELNDAMLDKVAGGGDGGVVDGDAGAGGRGQK